MARKKIYSEILKLDASMIPKSKRARTKKVKVQPDPISPSITQPVPIEPIKSKSRGYNLARIRSSIRNNPSVTYAGYMMKQFPAYVKTKVANIKSSVSTYVKQRIQSVKRDIADYSKMLSGDAQRLFTQTVVSQINNRDKQLRSIAKSAMNDNSITSKSNLMYAIGKITGSINKIKPSNSDSTVYPRSSARVIAQTMHKSLGSISPANNELFTFRADNDNRIPQKSVANLGSIKAANSDSLLTSAVHAINSQLAIDAANDNLVQTKSTPRTLSASSRRANGFRAIANRRAQATTVGPAPSPQQLIASSAIPIGSNKPKSALTTTTPRGIAVSSRRATAYKGIANRHAQATTVGPAPSTPSPSTSVPSTPATSASTRRPVFNRKAALPPVPPSLQNLQTPIVGASGTYAGWKAPLNVSTASARRLWSNPFHSLEWLDDDQLNDVINKVITNAQTPGTPESKYLTSRTIQDFKDRIDYIQNSGNYEGQAILDAKIVDLKRVLRAVDQGVQEEERLGRLAKKAADADTLLTPFMPNSKLANQMELSPTHRLGMAAHAAMYGIADKQGLTEYAKGVENFVKRSSFGNVSTLNIPTDLANQPKKDIVKYIRGLEKSASQIIDHHVDSAFHGLRGVTVDTNADGKKSLKKLTKSQKRSVFQGALDYADQKYQSALDDAKQKIRSGFKGPIYVPKDEALYKERAVKEYLKQQEDAAVSEVKADEARRKAEKIQKQHEDRLNRSSRLALINSFESGRLSAKGLIPTLPDERLKFDMGILGKLGSLARVLVTVGAAATALNSVLAITAAKMLIAAGDTRTKQRNIFNVGLRSSAERGYGTFSQFEREAYENARRLRTGTSDYIGGVLDLSTALRETSGSTGLPLGMDLKKTMRVYDNLALMAKISGVSQADMRGIMVQLLQGIGKGKLDMQDVKPILNRSGVMGSMLARYGFGLSGRGDLFTELERGNARTKTGKEGAGLTAAKLVENLMSERTTSAMEGYRRSLARTWEEVFTVMKDDIAMGLRSVVGLSGSASGGALGSSLLNFSRSLGQDEVVRRGRGESETLGKAILDAIKSAFGGSVDINSLGNQILHALGGILYISSMIGKGVLQAVGALAFIGTTIEAGMSGLAAISVLPISKIAAVDMLKNGKSAWDNLESLKQSASAIDSVLDAQKNIGQVLMDTYVNPTKLAENAPALGSPIEELQTSSQQTAENTAKISKNTAKITEIELALLKQVSGQTVVNRVSHIQPNIVTNIGTVRSGIEYKQMLKDIENAVASVM